MRWGRILKELIFYLTELVNGVHDLIARTANSMGWSASDKDLHLWVFGIVGILLFFFVHLVFKTLSQYSITAISFIYTFTVILVIVFAIEIQQKITGRGNMEFDDAIISLWGFLLFFAGYLLLKGIYIGIRKLVKR